MVCRVTFMCRYRTLSGSILNIFLPSACSTLLFVHIVSFSCRILRNFADFADSAELQSVICRPPPLHPPSHPPTPHHTTLPPHTTPHHTTPPRTAPHSHESCQWFMNPRHTPPPPPPSPPTVAATSVLGEGGGGSPRWLWWVRQLLLPSPPSPPPITTKAPTPPAPGRPFPIRLQAGPQVWASHQREAGDRLGEDH